MIYAYLTDGLDPEKRDEIDRALTGADESASSSKASRERQAVDSLLGIPGVVAGR